MKKKADIAFLNTVSSLLLQFISVLNGFIIPRLILQTFGSDVNGLVSSLTQFLNFISLLEGGVTAVIMASLYKPLHDNDIRKRDSIIVTTIDFYKKISYIFIIYSIILAFLYPLLFKTGFSYNYVSSLTLILSINLFSRYCFSLTWKNLLDSDKKVYITSFVQILCIVLSALSTILVIIIYPNIHILKLFSALIFLLQPIIFNIYVNKNYNINKKSKKDNTLIKERWNGLGINLAFFVHSNTDVTLLTIFATLKDISVYSTYILVIKGVQSILDGISGGLAPSIGHALFDKDKRHLENLCNQYELINFFVSFLVFTLTGILIIPFVLLYTNGINDANYYQPLLGFFMILAQLMYSLRSLSNIVAYNMNQFKALTKYAVAEAIINIVLSLILIQILGNTGVVIATFVAMTFRTISQIVFIEKNVIYRNTKEFYKKFIMFSIGSIIAVVFNKVFLYDITAHINIVQWIFSAIINGIVLLILYSITSYIFYKNDFLYIIKRLKVKLIKKVKLNVLNINKY